jgi:hypothetical protein
MASPPRSPISRRIGNACTSLPPRGVGNRLPRPGHPSTGHRRDVHGGSADPTAGVDKALVHALHRPHIDRTTCARGSRGPLWGHACLVPSRPRRAVGPHYREPGRRHPGHPATRKRKDHPKPRRPTCAGDRGPPAPTCAMTAPRQRGAVEPLRGSARAQRYRSGYDTVNQPPLSVRCDCACRSDPGSISVRSDRTLVRRVSRQRHRGQDCLRDSIFLSVALAAISPSSAQWSVDFHHDPVPHRDNAQYTVPGLHSSAASRKAGNEVVAQPPTTLRMLLPGC